MIGKTFYNELPATSTFQLPLRVPEPCLVTRPFVWDRSLKSIDREGLRESRTGTRQNWTNHNAVLIQIENTHKKATYPRSTPEVQGIKILNLPSQTGSLVHEARGWWDKNLNPWGTSPTWGRSGTYHPILAGRVGGKSPYLFESWHVFQCWKRLSDPRLTCNTRCETFEPGRWCYQKDKIQQKTSTLKQNTYWCVPICTWREKVLFLIVLRCWCIGARYVPYRPGGGTILSH